MDSMSIAASGMRAAATWVDSAASNIANMRSNGPLPATPPSQDVPQTTGNVYQATTVQQQASPDGGVSASQVPVRPSYSAAFDPGSPFADAGGMIATPNVDPATQFVSLIQAHAAFSASLAVYRTADSNYRSLLDLIA
jgi:flagellar basal-body rod protein FlgC